jgi:hypothetical protein
MPINILSIIIDAIIINRVFKVLEEKGVWDHDIAP